MKKRTRVIASFLIFSILFSTMPATAIAKTEIGKETFIDLREVVQDSKKTATDSESLLSAKTKAIVIIPGILGSSLENSTTKQKVWLDFFNYGQMALNEDGTSKYSIVSANYDNFGANDTYKALYNLMEASYGSKYDIIFFDYDWRLSNVDASEKLENELSIYSEVILVAHSMGGLVASKFLTKVANRSKTKALITIGTPYTGSAKCINVMETGDLINIFDFTLFGNTIKACCKNSYAAYQLLPTSEYYSKTGMYPITYNGVSYLSTSPVLGKTVWGQTADGEVKRMFSGATTFHSSLFSGGAHIADNVKVYTLGGTGIDTISCVNLNSNYEIGSLTYSNAGDGTVLRRSAGFGPLDHAYVNLEHTDPVSSSVVITRVQHIITNVTGIEPDCGYLTGPNNDFSLLAENYTEDETNLRGWIVRADNRRINIYCNSDSQLLIDGNLLDESNEFLYINGEKVGTVWTLGNTGRKMYALYNNDYTLSANSNIKIEYMDAGYFEKVVEYSLGDDFAPVSISNFDTMEINCEDVSHSSTSTSTKANTIKPLHVYSDSELYVLNQD